MYLISSAGGVGTTAFIKWLAQYHKVNDPDDRDGLKHPTSPPVRDDIEKAVYIYSSHPEAQVVSICRRFGGRQVEKLTGENRIIKEPRSYLAYYFDVYGLKDILENWLSANVRYKIVFVDFEILWNDLPQVINFLGLNRQTIDTFPTFRKRESEKILAQNKELNSHLQYIYQGFKEFVELKMYDNGQN